MNDTMPLHDDVIEFIDNNISTFYKRRAEQLKELKLYEILNNKNLYHFRIKNILTSEELIKSLLEAHLSSQEEGLFGGFFGKIGNPHK